jgi:hypothetical protein
MKKILLLTGLVVSFGFFSRSNAQCSVKDVGVNILTTQQVGSGCQATFNLTFKLNNNGGNKIVVIQTWKAADYPNYWNCSNGGSAINKAPKKADLEAGGALPFLNIAFDVSVNPATVLTSYGPDGTVTLQSGYTVIADPSAVDGQGYFLVNITGLTVTVPNQTCGDPITVIADVWSSQGSLNSQWTPHCIICNNNVAFNYPLVDAFMNCLNPRQYQVRIDNINTNQTIVSSWVVYRDDNNNGMVDNGEPIVSDSSTHFVTIPAQSTYTSTFAPYAGNTAPPSINRNLIVYVSTQGLPTTQIAIATNGCSPLPVKLSYFNAKRNNASNVSLTWQTAQELNSSGFEVQRQIGSGGWQVIGFVPTKALDGNSGVALNYNFNDPNNAKGITQYRLRAIDIDANSKFSEIRAVRGDGQVGKTIVYPNPSFDGKIKVVFEDVNGTRDVSLTDMSGRLVRQWTGVTNNNLQIDNLTSGYYGLRVVIRETGEQSTEKIVVNKR